MDKEQEEMQLLGLFGIYKESYKIILSWRKIFTKISLTLIAPLSFIFLFHIQVSNLLSRNILHKAEQMNKTPQTQGTPQFNKLSDLVSSYATFLLFELLYYTFLLIFSLLSTSAVVYTIASVYTYKEVTFKKVMSVVPKVWKRLMTTFVCAVVAFFIYNLVAALVFIMWAFTIGVGSRNGVVAIFMIIGVLLYFAGALYLTVVWHLASVVSVLEDSYGFEAMMKSKDLIKGKTGLSVIIFLMLNVSFFVIELLFRVYAVGGWNMRLGSLERTGYGVFCFLFLSNLFLFGLVIQTVLYFVCKSYHGEKIDKSALSDHLEVYVGEYEPLAAKDVQLEKNNIV